MEKIKFFDVESNEELEFFVLEETKLSGEHYLLVTEQEEGDTDAYILKELHGEDEEESVYEFVEDESVLDALSDIFAEMLSDVDFS